MSMVLGCCREVSGGPTIGFQHHQQQQQPLVLASTSSTTSIHGHNKHEHHHHHQRQLSRFSVDPSFSSSISPEISSSSSSINGEDSDQEEEEEECTSNKRKSPTSSSSLSSMQSIQDSLPIKRGLSNFFSGRSRSFADLSQATSVETLAKSENPFNKRRRTLMASKWSRQAFYSNRNNPVSMPLLKLDEEHELISDEDEEDGDESDDHEQKTKKRNNKMIRRFKPPLRCFSLTDLHHQQRQNQQQNV